MNSLNFSKKELLPSAKITKPGQWQSMVCTLSPKVSDLDFETDGSSRIRQTSFSSVSRD